MAAAMEVGLEDDRLERFRSLRARLDPSGDPARALAEGLYIRPTRSVSTRLAAELALAPASAHLVIGGVGSGKTTELLEACAQIGRLADTQAIYLDVTKHHDMEKIVPGAAAVQVGLALDDRLRSSGHSGGAEIDAAAMFLRNLAHGYWEDPMFLHEGDTDLVRVPGLLVSPEPELTDDLRRAQEWTKTLLGALRARWRHVVVLLDGLDRMTDVGAFERIINQDVQLLQSMNVGVVLVGPLKGLYGMARTITQRFGRFHYQPWVDITASPEAAAFLADVLRRRLPETAVDQSSVDMLVDRSGGVLRDLLALAQLACVEAYLDGSEVLGRAEVLAAIDSFGRNLMQGLRPEEIEVLQRVRARGAFVQTSEDDLALLMTRRVLEYRNDGRPRYAVHPTIDRFLGEMAGVST